MLREPKSAVIAKARGAALLALDCTAWMIGIYIACALRLETLTVGSGFSFGESDAGIPILSVVTLALAAMALTALIGLATGLHRGRAPIGSFEELTLLTKVFATATVPVLTINVLAPELLVPRTVPIIAVFAALVIAVIPRASWRLLNTHNELLRKKRHTDPTSVVIVGAGAAGRRLVDSMLADPEHEWQPVAFVDDADHKRFRRHRGIRVLGTLDDLATVCADTGASTAVYAIPSGNKELLRRVRDIANDSITLKILPGLAELMLGVSHTKMRDLEPADLLGRHQIETDLTSIAYYLTGKRVLIVGAGGSIGSELARQLTSFGPQELLLLDRDESALHSLMLSMGGRADLEDRNIILADIRDAKRMQQVMRSYRPHVVFHAAALKHVNMLESHPVEAVKSNVFGTLNVLEAALASGVERFVNISTDKAADPINVLGYSKRIAEGLTADFAARAEGVYLSVRFGNVLGTRGSVLKTFEAQVEKGGPVTVTDPDVTRYFMTVGEAVQLVIQAAAIGRRGEALVLDMGEPVRIADVAHQMVKRSGKTGIKIVYTGLKPGEKLHEALFGEGECDERPVHPLISHVAVPLVSRSEAESLIRGSNDDTLTALTDLVDYMSEKQPG